MRKDKAIAEAPKHARLSPSAAHRWLECPGSIAATANCIDVPTIYAAEGTMLHHFVYLRVKAIFQCKGVVLPKLGSKHTFDGFDFEITQEHLDSIEWCVERILQLRQEIDDPDAEWHFEVRLNLSCIEPGMFGTSDVIVVSEAKRTLWCFDYKFGKGVQVYANDNPQFIAYTIGAYDWMNLLFPLERFVFGVLQPRLDHYDTHEMLLPDLEVWIDRLKSGAAETHKPGAALKAGEHCKFCPAKATCPKISERSLAIAQAVFSDPIIVDLEPQRLTAVMPEDRVAEIVRYAPMIRDWLDEVEAEAKRRIEAGIPVKGFKLVAGRKSRDWTSEDAIKNWAKENKVACYDVKLMSPAQVEAICKSAKVPFPEVLVSHTAGAPSLVRETDKRPAIGPVFEALPSQPE